LFIMALKCVLFKVGGPPWRSQPRHVASNRYLSDLPRLASGALVVVSSWRLNEDDYITN